MSMLETILDVHVRNNTDGNDTYFYSLENYIYARNNTYMSTLETILVCLRYRQYLCLF